MFMTDMKNITRYRVGCEFSRRGETSHLVSLHERKRDYRSTIGEHAYVECDTLIAATILQTTYEKQNCISTIKSTDGTQEEVRQLRANLKRGEECQRLHLG